MKNKTGNDPYRDLDKKEHPLKFLYPAAAAVYSFLEKRGKTDILGDSETSKMLSRGDNPIQDAKLDAYKTISFILLTVAATVILAGLCLLAGGSAILDGNKLERAPTGQGGSEYELTVDTGPQTQQTDISVTVSEQKCPDDRLEDFFNEAVERLKTAVIGSNPSVDEITGNIELVKEIPGTSVKVSFDDPDPKFIYYDGTVRFENVTKPEIVILTAELTYFDEIRIVSFPIRLIPKPEDEAAVFKELIEKELEAADRRTADEKYMLLPDTIDGKEVGWKEKESKTAGIIAVLGLAAAFGVIPARSMEMRKRCREREQEMMRDYPDIISKFSLLLTAGMTSRGAWEKICNDYTRLKEGQKDKHKGTKYAYEEMLKAAAQMSLGKAESEAYEEFANRCRVQAYQRLGSLLSKNLRRGSREITGLLQAEAENAMEDRRQHVRQRGEEIGTKLLLPMFGMFGIVVAIVVVPAIGSMGI